MNTKQEQLRTRSIGRLLWSMAVPMMFSMLIQSLYNIIDSIFVAKLGNDALTAVSLIFPLQNCVISVAVGFGIGISSYISIRLGKQEQKQAGQAASIGVILSIVHSFLFILIGLVATRPFLLLFTKEEAILNMGVSYGKIVLCFAFGCLIQVCFEKIFQAMGEMVITMIVLATGAIINIILDPILIFGLLGFPKMGVTGAAIATVCGQICAMLIYVVYYYKRKSKYAVVISFSHLQWDRNIIKKLYGVGIPSTIMMALPSVLVSILNHLLVGFSDVHVAVLGIYNKLQTFIYLPANGLVQAMRPIIGYNYGAGETKRVHKTLRLSLLFTASIMAAGTILCLTIPELIFSLFDADEAMLSIGVPALRIISSGFLVSTFGIIYSGAFEALGMGLQSLVISLLRQLLIVIPVAYLLAAWIGDIGVWISFGISELIASIIAVIFMKRTLGKKERRSL